MRKQAGVTLLEMVVAFALFSLVGLVLATAFSKAGDIWRDVSGSNDTQVRLRKSQNSISTDLKRTSFESVGIISGTLSLGPEDSPAFFFLSAIDPATGQFSRTRSGTPFWQRNILYYLTVPKDHAGLYGLTCSGAADGQGYDIGCPHKVLIRKVIDTGAVTLPSDESTMEEPLTAAEAVKYLTSPVRFDTSSMAIEPGLTDVSIVATNLLTMRAELAASARWPHEIRILLSTVDILNAQREKPIGQTAFDLDSIHRLDILLQLFPSLP